VRRPAPARCVLLLLLASLGAGGCATSGPDPWEGPNRAIFAFNEGVDRYVLEPVAVGWDFVLPQRAQWGVTNFFDNLQMPITFLNDVLQLKPVAAAQDVGRFVVNTTVGVVGIFDVASRLDIPANDEDFGQTLGRYGVPPGPYMVLPLLGPSTARDTLAYPVDIVSQPEWWLVDTWIRAIGTAVDLVNTRSRLIEEIRESRRTAFDYYAFVRNAYLANRERKVRDGRPAPEETEDEDDLYYLDEELSDDGGPGDLGDEPEIEPEAP
jgi:phospholipid-binding lipoprotein MlaA